jgi:hypothetical protein
MTKTFNIKGFWSFDWLFGRSKIGISGDDLYGPQDGQFMIFGSYPYSRSRHRERSVYENSRGKPISKEEQQARLEGLARVAQANYDEEEYFVKNNRIYPYSNTTRSRRR